MDGTTAELRRLRALDRRTRLRASRAVWMLPMLFAVVVLPGLFVRDLRLAIAGVLLAGLGVMVAGHVLSQRAARDYGLPEAPASSALVSMSILVSALVMPLVASTLGWDLLTICGSALALAAGLAIINGPVGRSLQWHHKAMLAVPVVVLISGSLLAFVMEAPVGQPLILVGGLFAQGLVYRALITR